MTTENQDSWPEWAEPDDEVLAHLTRIGTLGADSHVLDSIGRGDVGAEQTRIAVQESLRVLLANGLITASRIGDEFYVKFDRPAS